MGIERDDKEGRRKGKEGPGKWRRPGLESLTDSRPMMRLIPSDVTAVECKRRGHSLYHKVACRQVTVRSTLRCKTHLLSPRDPCS